MQQDIDRHLEAVREVVRLCQEKNRSIEEKTAAVIRQRTVTLVALGVGIVIFLSLGAGTFLARSITHALSETIASLTSTSAQMAATIEEHERTAINQSAAVSETTATMDELDASFEQ